MSTARRFEPFRPPHDPATCAVCLYLDHVTRLAKHDPATCPGCLHAARQNDGRPEAAAAWAVAAVVVVFAVALYLIFSNDLAVLAR